MVHAFRNATTVFVARELSPEARSKRLAEAARAGVAELIAEGRATPNYRVFVDGREGAKEEEVKPNGGQILYAFNYLAEIVSFAIAFLRRRAPVGTGRYRDSFMVAVDGKPIPAADLRPRSIPLDAEIIIYNRQPYSRRVDVQLDGTKQLHYSVPAGLFEDAARAIRRQYGNTTSAKRVYTIDFPGQWIRKTGRGRTRGAGSRTQSPALIITHAR